MRNSFYLTVMIALTGLGLLSCKDSEKPTDNRSILIGVGKWKLISLRVGSSSVPIEPCMADNVFQFSANDQYIFDEGASKCDASDPQTASGVWSLSPSGELIVTLDGTTKITVIDLLTSSQLKVHYELGPLRYEEVYGPI